jgi:hypothetical protein
VATRKLTKSVAHALAPRDKVYIIYDEALPGFGVRVTPKGARSWIVEYRPHGGGRGVGKRRITIGPITVVTAEQARQVAGEPALEPQQNRAALRAHTPYRPDGQTLPTADLVAQ